MTDPIEQPTDIDEDYGPLGDEALTEFAEELFLLLDRKEADQK